MTTTDSGKPQPSAVVRWMVLLLISMAMFGNYSSNSQHDRTYWLDDVVVSTEPVR